MTCVVAVVLLAFVVFACGDPINVEKRMMPVGPLSSGLDLLGKDGVVGDIAGPAIFQALKAVIKNIRKTIEGLKVCPQKEGEYGHNEPDYEPHYEHGHQHDHNSDYVPNNRPSYRPNWQYRRESEVSKVDMLCEILKPLMEALVKMLKQLEKTLGCMMDKGEGYKGDYKECQ